MERMMKKLILTAALLWATSNLFAQSAASGNQYSTYYYQRASLFEVLPITSNDIVFIGNSITDGNEWNELFQNPRIKNRGISGDTTHGVLDRLGSITRGKPAAIFLMIGINNVSRGEPADSIAVGIQRILRNIRTQSPHTRLFVQSLLPITPHYGKFQDHTRHWQMIPLINKAVRQIAENEGATFIDLFSHFADERGQMKISYTNDGLHLLGAGYLLWKEILMPYISSIAQESDSRLSSQTNGFH